MPIMKCEASKATPLKGIEYIMDPAKVIAIGSQGLVSDDPGKMAEQMLKTMHLFGKGYDYNKRKYYHAKIAFDPKDRPEEGGTLTAESANRYAAKYAKKMWPGREVVWAVQDHGASIHIHFIIAACEQTTGRKLDARDAEYRRWKDYANELATEFGFSTLDWRKATREKREREISPEEAVRDTFAEVEMRRKKKDSWKDELRGIIDVAAVESVNMQEFCSALEKNGVVLTRCSEQSISYKLRDHKACRGDTLGGDYTMSAIQNALNHNAHARNAVQFGEIDSASQRKYRSWGRMAGMKREEIDMLCDKLPAATWKEKQALWETYKKARDDFWDDYQKRKNSLQQKLDEAYRWRQKAKEAEWALNSRNLRKSLGSVVFAGIYLHRFGGSEQFDACIEELRRQQEKLREEAREFKTQSNCAASVLKTKNLSLETYTDALAIMQEMAEDICVSGLSAVEYWARAYEIRNQLRMSGARRLEDRLNNGRSQAGQEEVLYQMQPVDWTKL